MTNISGSVKSKAQYALREALPKESIKVATMLRGSLNNGIEGEFGVDSSKLLSAVQHTIQSANGLALVLTHEEELVGCFMAELQEHAYCSGYIARELGAYIKEEHRGGSSFEDLLLRFIEWADTKPSVLMKTFSIGQLGTTTPYLRSVLKKHNFAKGDEGYYLI